MMLMQTANSGVNPTDHQDVIGVGLVRIRDRGLLRTQKSESESDDEEIGGEDNCRW